MAMKRAAKKPDDEQHQQERERYFQEAREALATMSRPDATLQEFSAADIRVHVALAGASGNKLIHAIMQALLEAVADQLFESLQAKPEDELKIIRREFSEWHAELVRTVENGDGNTASQNVYAHIMGFYRDDLRKADEFPFTSRNKS
jgi:DNA-binding FadR family transcriptional regulator